MKKYLLTIILSLITGFFLGNFLLNQYKDYNGIKVSKEGSEVYFLEYGSYSTVEEMEKNTINLENYIYNVLDSKYYVYIGMSLDKENMKKIQEHFEYQTKVKSYFINNAEFINLLKNYDILLTKTNDSIAISSIISEVLNKYEEVVNNGSND